MSKVKTLLKYIKLRLIHRLMGEDIEPEQEKYLAGKYKEILDEWEKQNENT